MALCSFPIFQIITPNVGNSVDFDCPLGISVFAGAIDVLKGIDLIYDSYCNEYRLGKKRIILPASMVQIHSSDMGIKPMFDDSIIEDRAAERENARAEVSLGVMSNWEYRAKFYNESEDKAKEMAAEIKKQGGNRNA